MDDVIHVTDGISGIMNSMMSYDSMHLLLVFELLKWGQDPTGSEAPENKAIGLPEAFKMCKTT